jgi:hypothetical protein
MYENRKLSIPIGSWVHPGEYASNGKSNAFAKGPLTQSNSELVDSFDLTLVLQGIAKILSLNEMSDVHKTY